jgi:hypothetical protein
MNIAIVYICTGRYSIFWKDFFESSEKYFLGNAEKHYFVYSDDKTICNDKNISVFYREPGGFPKDSLMRFEMFIQIEKDLLNYDYVYFFNSNMIFLKPVGMEILPEPGKSEIVGVIHPGYFNKFPIMYPYERNKNSYAYVTSKNKQYHYFMGSVIGGTSKGFMKLSQQCYEWTKFDLESGIIPVYHDESYLNKYFLDKNVHKLDPGYAYPEGWNIPFDPKIQLTDKILHFGKYFEKVSYKGLLQRIYSRINRFVSGLFWYVCD